MKRKKKLQLSRETLLQSVADAIRDGLQVFPVAELAREQLGMKMSPPTIWRWCVRGTRAGLLDAVFIGGAWHTTREALADFLQRQSDAQRNKFSRRRRQTDDVADAELAECGLL